MRKSLSFHVTYAEWYSIVKAAKEKGLTMENYMKSIIFPKGGYGDMKGSRQNTGLKDAVHKEAVKAKVKKEKVNEGT